MKDIDYLLPGRIVTAVYMAPIRALNAFVRPVLETRVEDCLDSSVRGAGIYSRIAEKESMGVSARPPAGQAAYHMRNVMGVSLQACVSIPTGVAAVLCGAVVGICRGKEAARKLLADYFIPITACLYAYLIVIFALSFYALHRAAMSLL